MMNTLELTQRESMTYYFLHEGYQRRSYVLPYERQYEVVKLLLGSDSPKKRLGIKYKEPPEEAPSKYLDYKEYFYYEKYRMYSRIFDLCRVLGITNIYDIGCETINQSFFLISHSNMSYCGLDSSFALNDWREEDKKNNNMWIGICIQLAIWRFLILMN